MKVDVRIRLSLAILLAAGAASLAAPAAQAQGPGGGMPPEMAAKIKLWRKYGEEHKKATDLGQTLRKVEGMNKEDEFKLDKKQSSRMLAILRTYSTKPTLSEDEAGTVNKQISSILTVKQIKKISTIPSGFGRQGGGGGRPGGGGPGGPGGGRPGGPGGPGGGRPGGPGGGGGFTFPDPPKTGVNPLNPNSMPGMMRDMAKRGLDEFKGQLEKQAH